MKKLMYILLFLIIAANVAAQNGYVVDQVCAGSDRYYRIDGGKGSTYEWYIKDTLGNEISNPVDADFMVVNSPGDTTWGSEISFIWSDVGIFEISTLHYSVHGCDTIEQGRVNVYEPPFVEAGLSQIVCINEEVILLTDTAWNHKDLIWSSTGDGTFDNDTLLHPTYTPGTNDINTGSVTLIITAHGQLITVSCDPAIDSLQIHISNPAVNLTFANLLCYNDSSGWIKAAASGGIQPYSFSWTGQGSYASTSDSIYNLAAGKYFVEITDGIGCTIADSIEITEPLELLALITPGVPEICFFDTLHLEGTASGGTGVYSQLWTGSGALFLNETNTSTPFFTGAPAGIYGLIYNVTDENGCIASDSIEFTVLPLDTIALDTIICGIDAPYAWYGKDFYTSGIYIDTLFSATECEKILRLDLTVLPIDTIRFDTIICIDETPFAWYGKDYFVTDVYTDTLLSATECAKILILDLIVQPIDTIRFDTVICGFDAPFAWYGKDYFTTNVYVDTLPSAVGCDTILLLDLTVLPIDTITFDTTICGMDAPFTWYGKDYFTTDIYIDTLTSATGCTNILILDLTVLPIDTVRFDTVICGIDAPFTWYGKDYFTTNIYTDTLNSATGCDSILILDLTVLPIDTLTYDTTICGIDAPYAWYGNDYYITGIYLDTLNPVFGCDTILVLNLTVLPIDTLTHDTIICISDTPFAWYGKDYSLTGIYTDTLFSATGCDSILILDLTVMPIDTLTFDTVICANETPYAWYGTDYFTSGIYTDTLPTAIGCDTIVILDLTVLPIDTIKFDTTICGLDAPFAWYGKDYFTTNIYTDTIISAFACDTILKLNLTVLPTDTIKFYTTICGNEVPFTWYGTDYFTTNIYTDTLISATGCDSILVLDLTVLPIDTLTYDTTICGMDAPFVWYGTDYFTTGIYTDTIISAFACDTMLRLNLTVLPIDTLTHDTIICISDTPFAWCGNDYSITGIYTDTLISATGCDSILILDLTVMPIDTITFDTTICGMDAPYAWYGNDYFVTGIYKDSLSATIGCDTILILDLTVLPIDTVRFDTVICGIDAPFAWYGKDYFTTGIFIDTLSPVLGCDTVLILDLEIIPEYRDTLSFTVCENQLPFNWNGQIFASADTIDIIVPTMTAGCDTIRTLQLQTNPVITIETDTVLCETPGSFVWNGHTIFTDRDSTYQQTFTSLAGCDSLAILNVVTFPATISITDTTLAEGAPTFVWNGQNILTDRDSSYQETLSNVTGCDSILIINVTIVPEALTETDTTLCFEWPEFIWNGQTIITDRDSSYIEILIGSNGLDSTVILNVNIIPVIPVVIDTMLCEGTGSFVWNGHTILTDSDSIYQQTLTSTGGCDSLLTLNVTILPTSISIADTILVEGAPSYVWNGQTILTDRDSIYQDTLINAAGCDSIISIVVTVVPKDVNVTDTTLCENSPTFIWNGQTIITYQDSSYIQTLTNVSGLDSTVILNVNIIPVIPVVIDTMLCEGTGSFVWNGHTILTDSDSIYQQTLTSTGGCDSLLTLNVIILPTSISIADTILVEGAPSYVWNGQTILTDRDSIYQDTLINAAGCDSIISIVVTVVPKDVNVTDTTLCENSPTFIWNGQTIITYQDSSYIQTLTNVSGLDSTVILNVNIIPVIPVVIDTMLCEGTGSFVWNGHTILTDSDSIYQQTLTSTGGCDSLLTLNVTILPTSISTADTILVEGAPSYVWNGQTILTDRDSIYQDTLINAAGCDSIISIVVTVVPKDVNVTDTTLCENSPTFIWNGQTIITYQDSSYIQTLTNVSGLDSTVILNVNIIPVIPVVIDTMLCEGTGSFVWNGHTILTDSDSIYQQTLTSTGGCDSLLTLNVTILPTSISIADTILVEGAPSYVWNGQTILTDRDSIYQDTLINAAGCDSIISIVVTVVPKDVNVTDTTLCENSPTFIWNGQTIITYQDSSYIQTLTNVSGLDSTVILNVNIIPVIPVVIDTMLCEGTGSFVWNGHTILTNSDGIYQQTLTSTGGCDSLLTLNVTILPTSISIADTILVEGAPSYVWNGQTILTDRDSIYQDTLINAAGCDSIVNIIVIVVPKDITLTDTTLCEDSPVFVWNGQNVVTNIDSTYTIVLTNGKGQDSTLVLNVNIIPALPPVVIDMILCEGSTAFIWNGQAILTDRDSTYQQTLTSVDGCDSLQMLNVTILPTTFSIADTILIEGSPTYVWNGQTIQTDKDSIYQITLVNAAGCDSIVNIIVIVVHGTTTVTDTIVCVLDLPVLWNGNEYYTEGLFIDTLSAVSGADSIVKLNIAHIQEVNPTFDQFGPYCHNSLADVLPLISNNGITGTWSPAIINTSKMGISNYIFTPDLGQCAVTTIIKIEIVNKIDPVFAAFGPYCQYSIAPVLPLISENGITGTWLPDTIITSSPGIIKLKFTPDKGHCAAIIFVDVEILPENIPVFAVLDPMCPNSIAPKLPLVSTNGITGTWDPAIIETSIQGTFTYTFTPDSGQCAVKTTLAIEISDIIPPVAICRDITVYLDSEGKASITTAQIDNGSFDNCTLDTLYLSRYNFDCADVGVNPVTLTAIDGVNLMDECEATVTVLDTISPTVICRGPFEIQLDENAEYKLTVAEVLENANDVCGIDTMWVFPHELNCDHIGLTTITLMVVDVSGNSSYCETEVMIYGNRPPTVIDDSASTKENVPVVIAVVDNDYDEKTSIDISSLALTIKPLHGKVSVNPVNGDFTYTPNLNFSGVDVFEYQICDDGIPCDPECGKAYVYVVVEPVNDKPIAVDDYYNAGCFSVFRNVLDNDYDPDSDNLTIDTNPLSPPNHGELIIEPDGNFNYFPNEGFVGIDSFKYVIFDNGDPILSDTATVYIVVDCNEETQNPIECELFIPEGFSPNEDGIHDFFRIMCIHNYPDAKLMIFNRNGDLLWEKEHYGNYDVWGDQYNAWWWGTSVRSKYDVGMQTINGDPKVKYGNYVYVLLLGNGDVKNGTIMVAY